MQILINEKNGFMPVTKINIKENKIEVEENNKTRVLKYQTEEISQIMFFLLDLMKSWKEKYIDESKIIDDEVYTFTIIDKNTRREIFIKNKYPNNWNRFILFRNRLLREELK